MYSNLWLGSKICAIEDEFVHLQWSWWGTQPGRIWDPPHSSSQLRSLKHGFAAEPCSLHLKGCTVGSVSIDRNPTYESCWATGKTQRFNHFLHWTKYPTHYTPYTPYTPYPARRTSIKDHKGCFFYVKTCKGTEPRMSDFSTLDTWATFINLPVIFKAKSLIKNHTAYSLSSPCCKGLIQQPFGNPRTLEFITGTSSRSWEARETTKARWKLKKDNLLNVVRWDAFQNFQSHGVTKRLFLEYVHW